MESFWKKAVSVTGVFGVAAFLMALLIQNIFQEKIIELFGSERFFQIVVALIVVVAVVLVLSFFQNNSSTQKQGSENGDVRHVDIKDSKVTGDIVLGDKNVGKDAEE